MIQRKRLAGNSGLGYYTSWEKASSKGCIYCGKVADTREHVPSKVFLSDALLENLPTIPACFECNNSYSNDERYVACFLDVLKSKIYFNYNLSERMEVRLEKDSSLKAIIDESIQTVDEKVCFDINENRLMRILTKLARGHAGYEFDYVNFDSSKLKVHYDYSFNLSDSDLCDFNNIPEFQCYPEVGSRGIFVVENLGTRGKTAGYAFWSNIQKGRYRYRVEQNEQSDVCVKIVIYEFLYSRAEFRKNSNNSETRVSGEMNE